MALLNADKIADSKAWMTVSIPYGRHTKLAFNALCAFVVVLLTVIRNAASGDFSQFMSVKHSPLDELTRRLFL